MTPIPGHKVWQGVERAQKRSPNLVPVVTHFGPLFSGPAPLEAVSHGAIFINPKFDPPHGRGTEAFFAQKPTGRRLTSQHPYLEEFVGAPAVVTVDIKDLEAVKRVLQNASSATGSAAAARLPFEFTAEGMLQRVAVLVENQRWISRLGGLLQMMTLLMHRYTNKA
jgi:hypothetical protein